MAAQSPDATMREKMLAGQWYRADDAELGALNQRARTLSAEFHATYPHDMAGAQVILRRLLAHLGEGAHVRAPMWVDYGAHLSIGAHSFINFNLTALDVCEIRIGEHCQLGPNVQLLTPIHPLAPTPRLKQLEAGAPIVVEDNVWLGGGVIVCPGVRIGEDTVVGAGSVVTKDLPAGVLAVGNPARVIKDLPPDSAFRYP
ncbi:MAG: sugar O-acetyltransferase [Bowdeniella nasicola]|nr:sugar O-acetyltransferase [Bowdeniella nasicola]